MRIFGTAGTGKSSILIYRWKPTLMMFATAPEDPTRFVPLMIVLSLAFLVPVILARFRRLPVVVGEILAGLIVGPSILGLVADGPILTFMADIGLAFLMFLAGLEIDFDALFPDRERRKNGTNGNLASQSLWIYLATLLLAIPGGFVLNRLGLQGDPWLLAFILSADLPWGAAAGVERTGDDRKPVWPDHLHLGDARRLHHSDPADDLYHHAG